MNFCNDLFSYNPIFGNSFHVYDILPSTNIMARDMANKGYKEGTVVIAREQSEGRGRMGKSFFSPFGSGIYMSLLLRPSIIPSEAALITAIAALSAAETIETSCKQNALIKWVNDIYVREKKVCGILAEGRLNEDNSGFSYIILGIGVNVGGGAFPTEIKATAGSVFEDNESDFLTDFTYFPCLDDGKIQLPALHKKIITLFLKTFEEKYKSFPKVSYIDDYKKRCFTLGKKVEFYKNNKKLDALAIDIDPLAGLVVEYKDKTKESLNSGEVSVLFKPD